MRINAAIQTQLSKADYRLKNVMNLLDSLSPLNVVDRGYSIASSGKKVLKSIHDVQVKEGIEVQLKDGIIFADVTGIQKDGVR